MNKLLAVSYPPYKGINVPADKMVATTNLENTISTIFGLLTVVAFIYFAIQLIFAGYTFISSNGDPKKLEEARHHLTNGILGLAIIVLAVGMGALFAKIFGIENAFNLDALLNGMGLGGGGSKVMQPK